MNKESMVINKATGLAKPSFILFNSDGLGYGIFPTDQQVTESVFKLESPLQRASAYINAYENMLAGQSVKPIELLQLFTKDIGTEKNELDLKLISGYISGLYWQFLLPNDRLAYSKTLEQALWTAMEQQKLANNKRILFNAYQNIYLSADSRQKIYQIWQQQKPPLGLKLY